MTRPCVVQKYGGSSVADVAQIRSVAERVVATRRTGVDVVVVVSAMGNTTNELLALAAEISDNPGRRELDLLISVGERVSMTLKAKDKVLFSSYAGSEIKLDGNDYLIMGEDEVLAVID